MDFESELARALGLPMGAKIKKLKIHPMDVESEPLYFVVNWDKATRTCAVLASHTDQETALQLAHGVDSSRPVLCVKFPSSSCSGRLCEWLAYQHDVLGAENRKAVDAVALLLVDHIFNRKRKSKNG